MNDILKDTGGNQSSVDAYVAKQKSREANFELFRGQFIENKKYGSFTTTVQTASGRIDRIEILAGPDSSRISSINLDTEEPISFYPTKSNLHFQRYRPQVEVTQEKPDKENSDILFLDFTNLDEPEENTEELEARAENTPDRIKADLQRKFSDLGIENFLLTPNLLRLFRENGSLKRIIAKDQCKAISPIFRSLEVKRLASDPSDPNSGYLAIATQRQHVYNQLTRLTKEAGMTLSQETEFLMNGIYDGNHVGGFTVFSDEGAHYLVVDYTFDGYDEDHPIGTNFAGNYRLKDSTELNELLKLADKNGYQTHFCGYNVSGGTHRHWNWNGIRINNYEENNPERNLATILKILNDLEIDPKSVADTENLSADEYMR